MTHKHILRLFALLAVFGLLLAACDQADESSVPERPSVVLKVGDQVYEEPVYSYCWPESTDNLDCTINDAQLTQPSAVADVQPGEDIHFQIVGDANTPSSMTATLLDGPGGVQDLGVSTEAAYSAALDPGLYRIQVDVRYASVESQAAYVSYIFGLNVSGQEVAAAPTVTAEATEPPAIEVTLAPTLTPVPVEPLVTAAATEAVPVITEEPVLATEAAEATQVAEATGEAAETEAALLTEEAPGLAMTAEATQAAVEALPLGELTPEATEAFVVEVTAVITAEATEIVPQPTAEVIEPVATEAFPVTLPTEDLGTGLVQTLEAAQATEAVEATATVAAEVTAEATGALLSTAEATEEPLATEEAPTVEATEEGVATTPTISAPARPTRTPETPTPGIPPTATLALPAQSGTTQLQVPLLTLAYAGEEYMPVGYQFCEIVTWGEHICVNVPSSETVPQRILFLRGLTVEFSLTGEPPSSITVEYRSEAGQATGTPETHESGEDMLNLIISPEPGDYIMIVRAVWDAQQQDASYFFRVSVLD